MPGPSTWSNKGRFCSNAFFQNHNLLFFHIVWNLIVKAPFRLPISLSLSLSLSVSLYLSLSVTLSLSLSLSLWVDGKKNNISYLFLRHKVHDKTF